MRRVWIWALAVSSVALGGGCPAAEIDPCAGVGCDGHGACEVVGGVAACACEAGYHAEGPGCVADPPDPCAGVDCDGHGACEVVGGVAACACEAGYQPEGLGCVADPPPDPCAGNDCGGHGTCETVDGAASCTCEAGFHPLEDTCVADAPRAPTEAALRAWCETAGTPVPDAATDPGAGQAQVVPPARTHRVELLDASVVLDQADTHYVLMADVSAPQTAFTISADDVTLDLNGHTVTYLTTDCVTNVRECFGVRVGSWNRTGIVVVNGRILQGPGACAGTESSDGCAPVQFAMGAKQGELAGLHLEWSTPDTVGINAYYSAGTRVHHNTLVDHGTGITNRHQGVPALEMGRADDVEVSYNLLRSVRHVGIRTGLRAKVHHNDLHLDGWDTNSAGITASSGAIHHNRVVGVGAHPIGLWPGDDIRVYSNYVEVENTRAGGDYGNAGSACLRMTWGNDNVEIGCNRFLLHAGGDWPDLGTHSWWGDKSWGRCLMVGLADPGEQSDIHHNVISALTQAADAHASAVATVPNDSPGLVFTENVIISNWANLDLADNYGESAGYPRFIRNTFVKAGDHPTYRTLYSRYAERTATAMLLDNEFLDGAGLTPETVELELCGTGLHEVGVGRLEGDAEVVEYYLTNVAATIAAGASVEDFGACGKKVLTGD